MELNSFKLEPEKLLHLLQLMRKKNLITSEQRIKAKELIVTDDPSLYESLRNYENNHKNLQILEDQFIYIINLNQQEFLSQSEDKKSSKKVKIIDTSDCKDGCQSRNSSSSSPMSRVGWKKPSFTISKQRMGAKVTKMHTEENMSDLNTTKESSPEKNQKGTLTANHTPKSSGLQRNQIVIPQLFIDEEDSSPLGKYLFEHKVVHQNVKASTKPRVRPLLYHINDDEFSSPQDTILQQRKYRQMHN